MFVLLIRTVLMFIAVSAAVRIMGKRTIGELQASDLVVVLLISDIAAVPMQENGVPLLSGLVPIAILTALEIIFSILIMKSPKIGRLICGRPIVIVAKGEIDQGAMRELRMTCEDLFEALRKNGVFDISAVDYAIMETDGTLSILKKASVEPPSAQMMGIDAGETVLRALIISDRSVDENSMKLVGWDSKKLDKVLRQEKMKMEEVFVLTGCSDGSYSIVRKENTK